MQPERKQMEISMKLETCHTVRVLCGTFLDLCSFFGAKENNHCSNCCRNRCKQAQDMNAMTEENRAKFYPQDVDSLFTGSNKDTHVAYYGEIVNAYVIE
jgi:hypothetical protein